MSGNNVESKLYTKGEINDIIAQAVAQKLTEIEPLFRDISLNPNMEIYNYVEFIMNITKTRELSISKEVLKRLKLRGVRVVIISKLNGIELMTVGSTKDKSDKKRDKDIYKIEEDKIELEIVD